ncbi:DUF3717 domain-containing protein [Cupriavidus sp. TMH.W2]|uniref:DUF3717 domain-containing protein n=1 Tax=Cupriavidus sp. TMH.W2 TaxID=3434465 RepID=UPI003D78988A
MSESISMGTFEAAINRCMAAHPPVGQVLGPDARRLADVYGECIYAGATHVDLSRFALQAEIIRKWLA